MLMYQYRATERGIAERNAVALTAERKARLRLQREIYEAKIEEAAHVAQIKRESADKAADMLAAMRANGYRYRHTFREIERRACKLFKVTPAEIRSSRRHQYIVIVRQFITYWSVRLTALSLPQLGRLMGGRDHTTCLHHKRKYVERRAKMGRHLRQAR